MWTARMSRLEVSNGLGDLKNVLSGCGESDERFWRLKEVPGCRLAGRRQLGDHVGVDCGCVGAAGR